MQAAEAKKAEQLRKQSRAEAADSETAALDSRIQALRRVLVDGVRSAPPLHLSTLRRRTSAAVLDLAEDAHPVAMPVWQEPAPPGVVASWFGARRRFEQARDAAAQRFALDTRQAEADEAARQKRVGARRRQHTEERRRVEAAAAEYNRSLDQVASGAAARIPEAVQRLAEIVLERLPQPPEFPRRHELLISPDGKHLVVRWQLPDTSVVPEHRAVHYLPTKDERRLLPRPVKESAALYRSVVAQVAVLVVRCLLVSDPGLDRVTFSGHVDKVDPATGEDTYPCLLSLAIDRLALPADERMLRDGFDAEACVTALGALVSGHPYAREPVEPFLDFDLTRFSFVEGRNAVSTLDSRPNLLQISPSLFEHLVRQVLTQKGDEGWTTTESNDSGIDAVLTNRSKVMGGLSVVQAKRYKPGSKIGPSHIRELAGAMEEKKAGWGILVTTSSFTAGSEQKAKEHGRMQLINGVELCWLIKDRTGKDVLIG